MASVPPHDSSQKPPPVFRRLRRLLDPWLPAALFAAGLLALFELMLAASFVPSTLSNVWGALLSLLSSTRLFLLVVLPFALLFAFLTPLVARQSFSMRLDAILSGLLAGCSGLLSTWPPLYLLHQASLDFAATRLELTLLIVAMGLCVCLLTYWLSLHFLARALRVMGLSLHQARVLGGILIGVSLGFCAIGHLVFASVHLVSAAGATAVMAGIVALGGARLLSLFQAHRASTASAWLLALIVGTLPFDFHPHARRYQFTAASTTAPLAALLRTFLDWDQDGASPTWLGGNDCAEGNEKIGPGLREIIGDGIDQDCRGGDATPRDKPSPTNPFADCALPGQRSILLLTIDALRADAITDDVMPRLQRFARSSITYEQAYAPSTMTRPSMGSVMTGQGVSTLYGDNPLVQKFPARSETLAVLMARGGLKTMKINWFTLDHLSSVGFQSNNPGFVDVQPSHGQLLAAGITEMAGNFVRQHIDEPFFSWVHYPDAHAPYSLTDDVVLNYPVAAPTAYQRGLEYIDHHLGRLLTQLMGMAETTRPLVVVTSDHGEDLGQRGRLGHGPYLFQEVAHIPLIVHIPGCAPKKIRTPVSLTWLGPTLAQYAHQTLSGQTLPSGDIPHPTTVVVEESPLNLIGFKRAIIVDSIKLIVDVQNGGSALFDLEKDPGEMKNIYGHDQQQTRRIEDAYQAWLDDNARGKNE